MEVAPRITSCIYRGAATAKAACGGLSSRDEHSYQLSEKDKEIFRRRYRYYMARYHDSRDRGRIHLHDDMLCRLVKYSENDRHMVKENLMDMWSLMTYGTASTEEVEVNVEQAIENYMTILHNSDEKVREQGKAIIGKIATGFFRQLDEDSDGIIALEGWMAHYSVWSGEELEECKRTFSRIDASGIGFLCLDDVVEAVQGFFCKASPSYYNNIFGPIDATITHSQDRSKS